MKSWFISMYCLNRLVSEIGASLDVAKVSVDAVKVPVDVFYEQFQLKGINSCK